MATRIVQNSFVGGELSPSLYGRHDIAAYFKGAARLENFMVLKTGGARKRWGMHATDTSVGDYLPADGTFKLIPYRYDRTTSIVFILTTPLSGNSRLRLVDKSLGWTVDPYGAMELDFRIEPSNISSVRHSQVGDTLFICSGASQAARKIMVNKETQSVSVFPISGLSAASSANRAFYTAAEWNYDYCPLSLSFRGVIIYNGQVSYDSESLIFCTGPYARYASPSITLKYAVVPVFGDGHEMFFETPDLESRMTASQSMGAVSYNHTTQGVLPYYVQVRAQFYTDSLPTSLKIYRSDQANYANMRLVGTVASSTLSLTGTSTVNGRTVGTYIIILDHLVTINTELLTADRAATGFEKTAQYYAVGKTGSITFSDTANTRLSVAHVGNAGYPDATHAIALSVSCVSSATPDTIDVYRGLWNLGVTGTAVRIATINTAAATVTTAAGTVSITHADSPDGLTRTYTVTDNGTAITSGGNYTRSSNAFAWTHYSAEASAILTSARPAAPSAMATAVVGMTGTYIKNYAAYGVSGKIFSKPALGTASIATSWTAGAYVTLTASFPAANGYDRVVIGKMSAGIYGIIATVYPGDTGWVETSGSVVVTVTDDNVTPSDPIYSQENLLEGDGVYGSDIDVFQQRIAVSGGNGIPFSMQFSAVGDLLNFWVSRPAQADEAFQITLACTAPSDIRHVMAFRNYLLAFTDSGVYRMQGGADGFSNATFNSDGLNDIGCSPAVVPVETVGGVLFNAADLRTVYELKYDLSQDAVIPIERSVLASHLTEGKTIVRMAYQRYPESIVWFVLSDGTMAGFTYQPENEVYAWHRHSVPGVRIIDAVATDTVTDALSDGEAVSDIVFAAVGADGKVRLCVFSSDRTDDASGTASDTVATLTTLRPELPDRNVQGIAKNVIDCLVRVRNTQTLSVVSAAGGVDPVTVSPGDGELFTGNVKIVPSGNINDDGQMTLVSDAGPCEIQCVVWTTEI